MGKGVPRSKLCLTLPSMPCCALPCPAIPYHTIPDCTEPALIQTSKDNIRPFFPLHLCPNASVAEQSPNYGLHTQPFQEPTKILLLDFNDTGFERVHAHTRASLTHNFLERVAEPVPPRAGLLLVLVFALAFFRVVVVFFLGVVLDLILVESSGFESLSFRFFLFPQLSFSLDTLLFLLLGFLLAFLQSFFCGFRRAAATETDDDIQPSTVVETGHDKFGAAILALGAVEFDDCFGDPEGEFRKGTGVSEELNVWAFFYNGHAECAKMSDLFLLD